jgi:pyridoxamine 5'-phosphate oxidase
MEKTKEKIRLLRMDFDKFLLDEKDISRSPFRQFGKWMTDAIEAKAEEVNAMTLATSSKSGVVDARIVLLRHFNTAGFTFFTNYKSEKGKMMSQNKNVCLNFFWADLQRQVRIRGQIEKCSGRISDRYFASRPRESQLSAWASHQSEKLSNRIELEVRYREYEERFKGKKIPRPPHWGGYIVRPFYFEFWQGRTNRLHDRIAYIKNKNNGWDISRLNP